MSFNASKPRTTGKPSHFPKLWYIEVSISTSEETQEMALLGENVNTRGAETKDKVKVAERLTGPGIIDPR